MQTQKIWDFIGRNRLFSVGDICMITNIDTVEVEQFCKSLEEAKYLEYMNGKYRCVNHTGKHVPIFSSDGQLIDQNQKPKKRAATRSGNRSSGFLNVINAVVYCSADTFCRQDIVQASGERYEQVSFVMNKLHHGGVLILEKVDKHNTLHYSLPKEVKAFCEICGASWADLVREVVDVR